MCTKHTIIESQNSKQASTLWTEHSWSEEDHPRYYSYDFDRDHQEYGEMLLIGGRNIPVRIQYVDYSCASLSEE